MRLPDNFTVNIAETFYDKTVSILEKSTTTTDGWVEETGTAQSTFKANVQFNNLGAVQKDLGLSEQADVSLTCSTDVSLAVDGLFEYEGETYKATAVIPRDSHLQIVGTKWR